MCLPVGVCVVLAHKTCVLGGSTPGDLYVVGSCRQQVVSWNADAFTHSDLVAGQQLASCSQAGMLDGSCCSRHGGTDIAAALHAAAVRRSGLCILPVRIMPVCKLRQVVEGRSST